MSPEYSDALARNPISSNVTNGIASNQQGQGGIDQYELFCNLIVGMIQLREPMLRSPLLLSKDVYLL